MRAIRSMDYSEAVEVVSELFRIKQWASNEYGERYAILDEDIEIRVFQESSGAMIIQGMFGEPIHNTSAANANEIRLKYLLQANFVKIVNSNDVLSIDKRTGRLAVSRYISLLKSSLDSLTEAIESFIQGIDFWDVALKKKQSFSGLSPLLGLYGHARK